MIKNKWIQWILIALPALALLGSGFSKLAGTEQVVKGLTALGVGPYITLIGVIEVVIVGLYLLPVTRNIGFFLICSYLGGAIIAHLAHGEPVTSPVVLLSFVWVVMFLTKPGLFLPSKPL
ncbi:DoxX family protein [Spirosoma flavum]|uniref:DoxX family protein n=1 Tax=Spirosoma flavum TaxID=2048557 RepID=A0ABW6AF19_9BACT